MNGSRDWTRAALVLTAGLAASLAADRWLPLASQDPLRGTLALLPFLVAAFHLLARWVVRCGVYWIL